MVGDRLKVRVLECGVHLLEVFAEGSEGADLSHLAHHSLLGDVLPVLRDQQGQGCEWDLQGLYLV